MKPIYSTSFILATLATSTLAISPDIYQSSRYNAFVEMLKRSTLSQTQSTPSSSSFVTSPEQEPASGAMDTTVRKINMSVDGMQDSLRLLGWDEDYRGGNIGRAGQLLFPEGMDVFAIRNLALPRGTKCFALPFDGGDGGEDDGEEGEMDDAVLGDERGGAEDVNAERDDDVVVEGEEDENDDRDEDEDNLEPYDQEKEMEAEAFERGVRRIPFNLLPEYVTIGGIICVRKSE